uniref:Uncharacterized protein n=1 Tax=Knipowitschia caucasica TaxID=637954 RepID=A0AAV2MDV7_KNICA
MLKPVVKPAEVAHLAPHSPSEPEVTPLHDSSSLGQISVRLLSPLYYLVMRRPLWLTRTTQHCVAPPAMTLLVVGAKLRTAEVESAPPFGVWGTGAFSDCGTELHLPRQFGDCQSSQVHKF